MKKLKLKIFVLFNLLFTSLYAQEFILNLQNVQSIYDLKCINGVYHVLVEIDDSVELVPIYKIENSEEKLISCPLKESK